MALAQGMKRVEVTTGDIVSLQTEQKGNISALIISNKSRANVLELVILGAPRSGIEVTLNGVQIPSLNEVISIPPNSPNLKLQAFGDFEGKTISIGNVTNSQNPATAEVLLIDQRNRH